MGQREEEEEEEEEGQSVRDRETDLLAD